MPAARSELDSDPRAEALDGDVTAAGAGGPDDWDAAEPTDGPRAADLQPALEAARALGAAGKHGDAERILRTIVERAPQRIDIHVALVGELLAQERDRDARDAVGQALAIHPTSVELRLLAATVEERLGSLDGAADHLATVLVFDPDHLECERRLGRIADRRGDTEAAIRCWRRVVELTDGDDVEALTALGIALSNHGEHDEAVEILSRLVHQRNDVGAALADLGMALLGAGRLDDALVALSRARENDPHSGQAFCGLGLTYQELGRFQEAAEAFRATERLLPESAVGPLNLGLALEALGDRKGARHALLRAAAIEPDDGEIREALARSFIIVSTSGSASGLVPISGAPVPESKAGAFPGGGVVAAAPGGRAPAVPGAQGFDASITGDLKSFQLFDVLEFLRLQNKTGALVVSSRQGAGQVRLARGAVTSASAPGVKRLGERLIDGRLIERFTLEGILSRRRDARDEPGEFLGNILLREGLVHRDQIHAVVFEQILLSLEEMLRWDQGAFSFHPDEHGPPPVVSFDLRQIMLDLMRKQDESERPTPRPVR